MLFCSPKLVIGKQLGKQFLQRLVHGLQIFEQFEFNLLLVKNVVHALCELLVEDILHQLKEPGRSELSSGLLHFPFNPLVGVEDESFCWGDAKGSSVVAVC